MAAKRFPTSTRLAIEPLETRNLLTAGPAFSMASFLASSQNSQDSPPAIIASPIDVAAQYDSTPTMDGASGGDSEPDITPMAATGGLSVTTLEDTAYTFTIADFGYSGAAGVTPTVSSLTAANVLVLYNTASAAGAQIANYYAQIHPGVRLAGITGVDANSEDITADDYLSVIRPQVLAALTSDTDVIVTTKGLPLRIQVTEAEMPLFSTYVDPQGITRPIYAWSQFSSLESELASVDTVSTWQMIGDQSRIIPDHFTANTYYGSNVSFSHDTYGTRLTARLDGLTVADVIASIDRAQDAEIGPANSPSGPYFFIVDDDPTKNYGQSMNDLVNNVLTPDGYPVVFDNTSAFVDTAPGPVIGYDSHGVHQASTPAEYLLNGLNVTLANGAVFQSWESYNAYSFNASNPHGNQGQIAEWLQIGGTAAVGHVEEPGASSSTVNNEDKLFRMLLAGYTFAEAAWSGNAQLSFVNTVIGDPLMTWQQQPEADGGLVAVKIASLPTGGTLRNDGVAVSVGQLISAADISSGKLVFTPNANFAGSATGLTIQVQDGAGLDPTASGLEIDVTAVNDAPAGIDKTVELLKNATYVFTAADFGVNDPSDSPANTLSAIKITSLPTAGLLTNNNAGVSVGQLITLPNISAGNLRFTPNTNAVGAGYSSFTFQVQDNGGTTGGGVNLDPSPNTITIDVVDLAGDTTPPSVTVFSPAAGLTNVATSAAVSVTFSESMNAATVNASTVQLLDGGSVVSVVRSYNAATNTVTLTPASALANSKTYTILVKGGASGVKDLAGNAQLADASSSFTTVAGVTVVTSSLWNNSATPAYADSGESRPIELGVKFTSTTDGTITGLKFYKSAANTGVHTAHLWSGSGQLLATAVFTGETGSGWQQVNLATPVAITAGATYVASYFTTTGHYSITRPYFNVPYTNGPLTVPVAGGVYRYGVSAFPTMTYQNTNYWVDLVLSTVVAVDATPPVVSTVSPAGGATSVATYATPQVTFSEAMSAATVNSSTVQLLDGGSVVSASVSYNAGTKTATITPAAALGNSKTYTILVTGGASGVKDLAGNALAVDASSSFTTAAAGVATSIWNGGTTPTTLDSGDTLSIELGVKFIASTNGTIAGVRFYKSAANTGVHTASLWNSAGQLLATATFSGETGSGWQQVNFATPVAITAGATYTASYHTNTGHYSVNRSYFNSGFTSGFLSVPVSGGVYRYGASAFPSLTYQGSNYWVDPVFVPGS